MANRNSATKKLKMFRCTDYAPGRTASAGKDTLMPGQAAAFRGAASFYQALRNPAHVGTGVAGIFWNYGSEE
jgi:hypothetical protein